ncbi:MAG: ADP-ribosylglycohydrolase family protein [bacterium]|nr:ADP-ribosylglycohydrolase family protein [bacterium]
MKNVYMRNVFKSARLLLKDKFIGSMLGTFVGDALGMPVEGYSMEAIKDQFGEIREMLETRAGKGTYTDDTEMMIGTAESLIECRGFNGEHMAKCFLENYHENRGYGGGTKKALSLIRDGELWHKAGEKVVSGGSYGNGSAMRMAPIGILYFKDEENLRKVAHQASLITHAHTLGKDAAAIQAFAVAKAIQGNPNSALKKEAFIDALINFAETSELKTRLESIKLIMNHNVSREKIVSILGHSSVSFESVPASIYSFLKYPDSFEEAVVYAISLGGDTDTIGAMTGAISGAFLGIEEIPERWLNQLENTGKAKAYVNNLAEKLWEIGNY